MRTVDSWFTFEKRCLLCGQKIHTVGGLTLHLERHKEEGYLDAELQQVKPHPVGFPPGPPPARADDLKDGWFLTFSGLKFYPTAPAEDQVRAEDVAHALSQICRFGGHCRKFWSVGQHSLLVSGLLPEELQLQGLLHDAPEAYLGDVVRPLKVRLPHYKNIESRVWDVVSRKFGCEPKLDPLVKEADNLALSTERRFLFDCPKDFRDDPGWGRATDASAAMFCALSGLSCGDVAKQFLAELRRLSGRPQ